MAGRGPAPKEKHTRPRDDHEVTVVLVPHRGHRELPDDLLDGEAWHPATLRWWNTWAESPLTANLPEVDWCELEACAVLHHQFMRKRTFTLASELRLRVAKFGATPEDRMRLKVKIETPRDGSQAPTGEPSATVTAITSRRGRLTS